jgi:hypothetical protein
MREQIDPMDRLLVLKKPFDTIEILQMANALTQKWLLLQESKNMLGDLQQMVGERTRDLEASQAAAVSMMADAVRNREKAEMAYEELKREMTERIMLEERFREQASLLDKAQDAILVHDLGTMSPIGTRGPKGSTAGAPRRCPDAPWRSFSTRIRMRSVMRAGRSC